MGIDTTRTAMIGWRAQALFLEMKQDKGSFSEKAGGVAEWGHASPESCGIRRPPPAPTESSGQSFGRTSC